MSEVFTVSGLRDHAACVGVHFLGEPSRTNTLDAGELGPQYEFIQLPPPPVELAGRKVVRVDDLIGGDAERGFVPSDVLIWHLDGGRIVVRPSGTEPKLKAYVEVVEPVGSPDDLPDARSRAVTELEALVAATAAATGLG